MIYRCLHIGKFQLTRRSLSGYGTDFSGRDIILGSTVFCGASACLRYRRHTTRFSKNNVFYSYSPGNVLNSIIHSKRREIDDSVQISTAAE